MGARGPEPEASGGPDPPAPWSGQPLTDLLAALTDCPDEATAVQVVVDGTAAATGAEVVAYVPPEGGLVVAAGSAHDQVTDAELHAVAATGPGRVRLTGIGPTEVLVMPLHGGAALVLARASRTTSPEEAGLVAGTAQVLNLTLRQLRLYEAERAARAELQDSQRLLERLYGIQRAIARRQPLDRVLGAVCESGADLLGDVIVGIRLIDSRNPSVAPLVAWVGLDPGVVPDEVRLRPAASGVSGQAMREQRLVVAEDYRAASGHDTWYADLGLRSSMAAPVTRDNEVVGAMVISSLRTRSFTELEHEVLLTLAEHVSLALNDASALRSMADALDDALHQATHDPLTALPNRTLVLDRLAAAIARTTERGREVSLLFLDLDRFKRINDLLGHRHGDAVLVTIGDRLRATLRAEDTVGRLGGDEFVVVAEDLDDAEVDALATRLAEAVAEPVRLEDRDTIVTASIGIARATARATADEVLGDADVALYRAKRQGRSRIERFDQELRTTMADRAATVQALHQAMRADQLRVWYQPAVWTPGPRPVAVEALVRWERPGHGLVEPSAFVDLAEDTGLIVEMGAWILGQACRQVMAWRAQHPLRHLRATVNLSPRQLTDPRLADLVQSVLGETGLPPDDLWLEMTEHVLLEEDETSITNVLALRAAGVHLVIDDFGTGYSSLAYLKRFPVDAIKIDRSFVAGLDTDPGDQAIVTAIVRLGEALGLGVVAEGVERVEELDTLTALGCELVQGLLFGGAQPPEEALASLLRVGR